MKSEQYLRDHSFRLDDLCLSRRQFLQKAGMGFGAIGLAGLLSRGTVFGETAGTFIRPQFPSRAARVIHIFAQGGPSHVDTWDPKPLLNQRDGQELPDLKGVAMGSSFKFSKHGRSGIEVSEAFPELAKHVDDMTVIRSMYTDIPAHDVATVFMNTGSLRMARPSLGAWTLYGLGSENENMPGFISLRTGGNPPGGVLNWGSAFLPGNFQATSINTRASSVDQMIQNIRNHSLGRGEQRRQLDLVQRLNTIQQKNLREDPQLDARIKSFEMAYRMQMEATDAFDVSKEPQSIRELYGNSPQGKQMLIARRLIERGVRFVQVWASGWDHHEDIANKLAISAKEVDRPAAALLTDLKQRGLLDSTLVIWGGEFGRTVTRDRNGNEDPGRDHNNHAFSMWLAGGGVKGGTVYGATDEFGARAVDNKVHVHDLHATVLRVLGFDHTRLTYRYNGRDFRLTDNYGKVVNGILA